MYVAAIRILNRSIASKFLYVRMSSTSDNCKKEKVNTWTNSVSSKEVDSFFLVPGHYLVI